LPVEPSAINWIVSCKSRAKVTQLLVSNYTTEKGKNATTSRLKYLGISFLKKVNCVHCDFALTATKVALDVE
jgi:hypothetical protein